MVLSLPNPYPKFPIIHFLWFNNNRGAESAEVQTSETIQFLNEEEAKLQQMIEEDEQSLERLSENNQWQTTQKSF